MMKDVTKAALRQNNEYGRPVKMNITRVDNYVSKAERIFDLLGQKEWKILVTAGGDIVEKRTLDSGKAKKLIRWYGKRFFMNIYHRNGDRLVLDLYGVVPVDLNDKEDEEKV